MVLRGPVKFLVGLLAVLVFFGAVLGVVAYFSLKNFDPNVFRAVIENELARQTDLQAELGDFKLQWVPQPQFELTSLKLYHSKGREKLLQSGPIRIVVDLTAVLQKRFGISELMIQSPEVFLRRSREGLWNWEGARKSAAPTPSVVRTSSQGGLIPVAEAAENASITPLNFTGWAFRIGKVLIRNASVHYADESVEPAYQLDIDKVGAQAREPSFQKVFHFSAGGTLFHAPQSNLDVEGDLDPAAQSLDFLLRYGPQKVMLKGQLKIVKATPYFKGAVAIQDLDLESVTPAAYKKGEHVTGRLSAEAQIALGGADPAALKRSLQGQGTAEILDGALRNRNLIKEVFDRLSPVMAVTSALGGELPPEMNAMLGERDTPFQSLKVSCEAQKGLVNIREFRLTHSNYQLSGPGNYGLLDARVNFILQLMLSKTISAYLMKKIHEMSLLADGAGQVVIPFRYSGILPNASVQPDLKDIGARLLQGGAEQLLDRGLERLSKYLEKKRKQ